jgi:hypothetical protein
MLQRTARKELVSRTSELGREPWLPAQQAIDFAPPFPTSRGTRRE